MRGRVSLRLTSGFDPNSCKGRNVIVLASYGQELPATPGTRETEIKKTPVDPGTQGAEVLWGSYNARLVEVANVVRRLLHNASRSI